MGEMSGRMYRAVLRRPRAVLVLLGAVTVLLGIQAGRVRLDNSIYELLPRHEAIASDRIIKKEFDSRELILAGLVRRDASVFEPGTLEKVRVLSRKIEVLDLLRPVDADRLKAWEDRLPDSYAALIDEILEDGLDRNDRVALDRIARAAGGERGIESGFTDLLTELRARARPIDRVLSIATVEDLVSQDGMLRRIRPLDRVPDAPDSLAALAARMLANPLYRDGLISRDGHGTVIAIKMAFFYDDAPRLSTELFRNLESLIRPVRGPEEIRLAGVPVVNTYTSNFMMRDLERLTPLVVLLVAGMMFLAFGSLRAAFIPLESDPHNDPGHGDRQHTAHPSYPRRLHDGGQLPSDQRHQPGERHAQ